MVNRGWLGILFLTFFCCYYYYYEHGIAIGVVVWRYGLCKELFVFVLRLAVIHDLCIVHISNRELRDRLGCLLRLYFWTLLTFS